jgi:hypothetical protein
MTGQLRRLRRRVWALAAIVTVPAIIGLGLDPHRFLVAYLEGYLIWMGIVLGCLGIWVIHNLVGGQWGDPIGRIVQASARTLPLMAVLFLPILLGMRAIFPWMDRARVLHDPVLSQKIWYLNVPFFIGRNIVFFAIWLSPAANDDLAAPGTQRLQNLSGLGALLLFFSASFAAFDWVLTLQPYYYSTLFGPFVLMGQLLGAFAFCTFGGIRLARLVEGGEAVLAPEKLGDLGNLILMSIVLWMYMVFSQYLITWSGQIRAEVSWYNVRFIGGWQWLGGALLAFNFVVPLVCLLFRPIKRNPRWLCWLCGMLGLMQWVDALWLVGPSFSPMAISLHWLDIAVPVALGSIWVGAFLWRLEKGVPPFARGHAAAIARYAA